MNFIIFFKRYIELFGRIFYELRNEFLYFYSFKILYMGWGKFVICFRKYYFFLFKLILEIIIFYIFMNEFFFENFV